METVRRKSVNIQIFRALLSIASAALLIRVMGMANQVVVSAHFGVGATMDAYFVASLLPITIADLVVGTIQNSVIPTYARVRTRGTIEQASVLFSTLLNLLLIGAILFSLLLFVFRRQMVYFSAPALNPSSMGLAVDLTPFILPALLLMTVIGFLESILNTEGQFGLPAYAGALVPIATAILVLVGSKSLGVVTLGVGMVIGLCLQLCIFVLRIKRVGLVYRPIIDLRHTEIGLIALVAWPALLGSLISQVSPLIDQVFASFLSSGSISALNYALKIISVPIGVIALSVGRAAVPYLSRQAAAYDMKAFKATLRLYLWGVGIGITVLSALMLVLANPLVQFLFQRGQFSADNTNHTATTLIGFVVGLTPMALVFIVVRAFSALSKTRVLMYIAIFNVVANAILDYIFARLWQSEGIALATSVMYFCAMIILLLTLRRMIGKLDLLTPPPEMLKMVERLRMGHNYQRRSTWKKANFFQFAISSSLRRHIIRICIMISVFAIGITGALMNSFYTLRIALGSVVMLALLRYRYVLLLAWVLITVVVSSNPIFTGNNFLTGLTAPTLLLMACMPIKRTFKRMPALAFLLLFFLWVFAGIGISPLGMQTFLTTWLIYLDYVAIGILTINVLTTEQRVTRLIDAILLAFTFVALYGIYGYFTRQNGAMDPVAGFRIFSIFGSSPALGLFLSMGIPLAFYRTLTLQGFRRIGCLIMALVLLVALGMTFSRGAFIGLALSTLIMAFFLPTAKMKVSFLSAFLVLAVLLVLLMQISDISLFYRFFQQDTTTLNGRTDLWQIVLDRFDPTQLLGYGLNASGVLLANLGANGVHSTNYEPHSLFVSTLYDHGIIGLTLLTLVFIALFVNLMRGLRKTAGTHRMLFVTVVAIFVSVFSQSFAAVDLMFQGIGLYFWIIMALPFALYWSAPKPLSEIEEEASNDDEATASDMQARRQTEGVSRTK